MPLLSEEETQQPIFVLSSGRTGSTFLARLIRSHPELLPVSDLIEPVGEIPYLNRELVVDGAAFFQILSAPSFKQRIAYWRHQPNAELLYLPEDDNMVSLLLCYALPFLSSDPMALFVELKEKVSAFPKRPMPEQFTAFCDLLRDIYQKKFWVERTGGSLPHSRQMIETWPNAKFIYNYRDPRETAISMMTGSFFRLYLELIKNPDLDVWDWDYVPPIEEMAEMLNGWVVETDKALATVDAKQKFILRFEDLVINPYETMLGLSRFIFDREPNEQDRQWAESNTSTVKKPRKRFSELAGAQQSSLERVLSEAINRQGYDSMH